MGEEEIRGIHFEVGIGDFRIISKESDTTEYAIVNLQIALPSNISIAYCQTCCFGNFNPYGDIDNEIFCLREFVFSDKTDVCKFSSENRTSIKERSKELLGFCDAYLSIRQSNCYVYNDWEYRF